jgi:hypothetical protein
VVAGWIPALAVGEVGRRWWLGRHGNVGNPIESSRGGLAHRRRLLAAVAARQRGVTGARTEEQWVELVVGLVGTRASWWSSRMERRHQMRTRVSRRLEALRRQQNPMTLSVGLLL